jgi:protein CpxP
MKLFRYFALAILVTTFPLALCRGQQAESREAQALQTGGTPYFTTKMENLTKKLDLSPDQQAKLKPIALQEVSLLGEIRGTSGLSRKQKIARLQQIVENSDKQMKPWLSEPQWEKLQALRKEQKEKLKEYAKTK